VWTGGVLKFFAGNPLRIGSRNLFLGMFRLAECYSNISLSQHLREFLNEAELGKIMFCMPDQASALERIILFVGYNLQFRMVSAECIFTLFRRVGLKVAGLRVHSYLWHRSD
jgi:hypothetical protein